MYEVVSLKLVRASETWPLCWNSVLQSLSSIDTQRGKKELKKLTMSLTAIAAYCCCCCSVDPIEDQDLSAGIGDLFIVSCNAPARMRTTEWSFSKKS